MCTMCTVTFSRCYVIFVMALVRPKESVGVKPVLKIASYIYI